MPATFIKTKAKGTRRETIRLDEEQSFTLLLAPPTYEHQLQDAESVSGYQADRFEQCVTGWEGVVDEDGEPVPFDLNTFKRFCEVEPSVFVQTVAALGRLFVGIKSNSEQLGNSGEPSSEYSEAADGSATTSTSNNGQASESQPTSDTAISDDSAEEPVSPQSSTSAKQPKKSRSSS